MHLFAHEDRIHAIRVSFPGSDKKWHMLIMNILPISLFDLSQGYFEQRYLKSLLSVIYFLMNYAFPIGVLLFIQIKFLPYHHANITFIHQVDCLLSITCSALIYLRGNKLKLEYKTVIKLARNCIGIIVISLLLISVTLLLDFPRTKLDNESKRNVTLVVAD